MKRRRKKEKEKETRFDFDSLSLARSLAFTLHEIKAIDTRAHDIKHKYIYTRTTRRFHLWPLRQQNPALRLDLGPSDFNQNSAAHRFHFWVLLRDLERFTGRENSRDKVLFSSCCECEVFVWISVVWLFVLIDVDANIFFYYSYLSPSSVCVFLLSKSDGCTAFFYKTL